MTLDFSLQLAKHGGPNSCINQTATVQILDSTGKTSFTMRIDSADIDKALSTTPFDFAVVIDSSKADSAKIVFTTVDAAAEAIASIPQIYI